MTEKLAQELIDFIVKKSKMYNIGTFVYVGAINTLNGQKQLYQLWAALDSYKNFQIALSYGYGKAIDLTSKLFPEKFEKVGCQRALKKMLEISAKGYDIFCGSMLVLKRHTTLEHLLIEMHLASYDKE